MRLPARKGASLPRICPCLAELQRYGMDVEALLATPTIRKFVDWVANKDPDFSATMAKKQR